MNSDEKMIVEGICFNNRGEFELAKKELETIRAIERKCSVGDARVALSVYNKAVSKKSFKTVIGYMFLNRLRETIISCGLVSDAMLNPIPVQQNGGLKEPGSASAAQGKYELLYNSEKGKNKAMAIVIAGLVLIIAAMFFVTGKSKYSFATYFTDYENNIRNEVVNEYEEWEKELKEREEALNSAAKN